MNYLTDIAESIAEQTENEPDLAELVDDLLFLAEHPVNLNSDDIYELKRLHLLNDVQINSLLMYKRKYGNLVSVYELQAIDGFDKAVLENIIPFITAKPVEESFADTSRSFFQNTRHKIIMRYSRILEDQKGYLRNDSLWGYNPNKYYLGSPEKLYLRYSCSYSNKIRFGFIAEKDAGEVFVANNIPDTITTILDNKLKKGFDFYSVYLSVHQFKFIKTMVIGDYHLQFGQGLTLWSGFGFGKSPDAITLKKYPAGIKPNTSSNECLSFRGAGTTLQFRKLELSMFYSQNALDANVTAWDSIHSEVIEVSTLQESGLHRTVNELLDKNILKRQVFGGNLSFRSSTFNIGVTALNTSYKANIIPNDKPYNLFAFSGRRMINLGLDFNLLIKRFNVFGEIAFNNYGGMGVLIGSVINMNSLFDLAVLYRNYGNKYYSHFSVAFSENTINTNEEGFYLGIHTSLFSGLGLSAYLDIFRFPWLKYQIDGPSYGKEGFVQLHYNPGKDFNLYFRFRYKNKQKNCHDAGDFVNELIHYRKYGFRFQIEYHLFEHLILKNRVESMYYKNGYSNKDQGYLLYQDIQYHFSKPGIRLYFRYALFDTDNWSSRIYAYENDVLYAFTIPAYYDKGTRIYIMIKWSPIRKLNIWVRISRTIYDNKKCVGSGLNEIDGNTSSEIKLQAQYKF